MTANNNVPPKYVTSQLQGNFLRSERRNKSPTDFSVLKKDKDSEYEVFTVAPY